VGECCSFVVAVLVLVLVLQVGVLECWLFYAVVLVWVLECCCC